MTENWLVVKKSPSEPTTSSAKSTSSKASPSIITLCLLTVEPSFRCISLFTTTFIFLLKKKLEGGNYSTEMSVSSSMNITSAFGFPLVNCDGVMNWMGLSISVDDCFPVAFVVDLSSEISVITL
jgi:hypothetical protein